MATVTRRRISLSQLEDGVVAGLVSGRFRYRQHSSRIECTHCGRSGWATGWWAETCVLGHPYVCACGRVFSTRQGIASHRRHQAPQCNTPN